MTINKRGLENFKGVGYTTKRKKEASVAERSNARDCKSRAHWATQVRILPDAQSGFDRGKHLVSIRNIKGFLGSNALFSDEKNFKFKSCQNTSSSRSKNIIIESPKPSIRY